VIFILKNLIVIHQPADYFYYFFFGITDQINKFFRIRFLILKNRFYLLEYQIKFIFAQFEFIPVATNITDSASVRFLSKII